MTNHKHLLYVIYLGCGLAKSPYKQSFKTILGFVNTLLRDLWFCLEGGEDDNKILSPRIKENGIEKTLHKVLWLAFISTCFFMLFNY